MKHPERRCEKNVKLRLSKFWQIFGHALLGALLQKALWAVTEIHRMAHGATPKTLVTCCREVVAVLGMYCAYMEYMHLESGVGYWGIREL